MKNSRGSVLRPAALAAALALAACAARGPGVAPAERVPEGPWRVLETAAGRDGGRIEVLEHRGSLALSVDGVFQTVVPPVPAGIPKGLLLRGGDHAELVPWLRPGARTVLLVGLGGGLHVRALEEAYGMRATAAEIEPEVARIARERFGIRCGVIEGDGREVLERDPGRFDAVVIDAFSGESLPERLFTREAFEAAARRLAPDGVLAVHLIGRSDHPAVRAVAGTLQTVFPEVLATRAGLGGELGAIYLFASTAPLVLGLWTRAELEGLGFSGREIFSVDGANVPVLTDARSTLRALARDIADEHRRLSLEMRRNPPW
jgi:SAM-dependent methyltransferase